MIFLVLSTILPFITLAVYLPMAVLLVWTWARTREKAFAWLGVAVVIWPLLSHIIDRASLIAVRGSWHGQAVKYFPYDLARRGTISMYSLVQIISRLEQLIGAALVLTAVFYLCRMKTQNTLRQEA
ncbi:MAG TPA: hypothetical protein VGG42_16900 [Acidobacteriaceae bacterium]|jgi:hypothetical protein